MLSNTRQIRSQGILTGGAVQNTDTIPSRWQSRKRTKQKNRKLTEEEKETQQFEVKPCSEISGKNVWSCYQFGIWHGCNAFRQPEMNAPFWICQSIMLVTSALRRFASYIPLHVGAVIRFEFVSICFLVCWVARASPTPRPPPSDHRSLSVFASHLSFSRCARCVFVLPPLFRRFLYFPNCLNDKLLFSYCPYYSFQPHSGTITCTGKIACTFQKSQI